jgi:hypothetical protein
MRHRRRVSSRKDRVGNVDFERLLTRPEGFGLDTATTVQRAVCRLIGGTPYGELRADPDVIEAFGGEVPADGMIPKEILLLAGIRGGKTLTAAAAAVFLSQTCDLTGLGKGDMPRIAILSTMKDQAKQCLQHLKYNITSSPVMRDWLVSDPTSDTVVLRHPSGRPIEVTVVAGSKAGATLVSRWMVGVIFDEAPRISGDEDSVVNLRESRRAILGRMRPGCPIIYIGSPWAPFGIVYEWFLHDFGKPNPQRVVVKATGPMMNPSWWTPERCEELKKSDDTAYKTDVLAEFADIDEQFFSTSLIESSMRADDKPIAYDQRHHYVATMDPATRSNAWTLTIGDCTGLGGASGLLPKFRVVAHAQWKAQRGDRLSPKRILGEISSLCEDYHLDEAHTDQYSADALADLAQDVGLTLLDVAVGKSDKYEDVKNLHTCMSDGRLELPGDALIKKDLQLTKRRVTIDGISIRYQKTPDGRHCDYTPSLALLMRFPPEPPEPEHEVLELLEARRRQMNAPSGFDWDEIGERMMGRA